MSDFLMSRKQQVSSIADYYGIHPEAIPLAAYIEANYNSRGGGMAVLLPASLFYLIGLKVWLVSGLAYYGPAVPMLPDAVSGAFGLAFTTWGLGAMWWLTPQSAALSLRRIGYWWPGIVGGTLDVVLRIVSYAHSPDADTRIFIGPLVAVLLLEAVLLIRISRNKGK
jgi:hypothetical protein